MSVSYIVTPPCLAGYVIHDKQALRQATRMLVGRISEGNNDAFNCFYQLYKPIVLRYLGNIPGSPVVGSEDVLQEIFSKLWLVRDTLNDIQNLEHYLATSVKNLLITQARRRDLQYKMIDHYSLNGHPGEHTTEQELAYREVHHAMLKMLGDIPDRARRVYVLRQFEGMPVRDIAVAMNISEKTVKHHLQNARQRIRAKMQDS